jgi:hypothetical protein
MAACYLKLSKPEKALATCDKILAKDESNVKAIFRKGEASVKIRKLDQGVHD